MNFSCFHNCKNFAIMKCGKLKSYLRVIVYTRKLFMPHIVWFDRSTVKGSHDLLHCQIGPALRYHGVTSKLVIEVARPTRKK